MKIEPQQLEILKFGTEVKLKNHRHLTAFVDRAFIGEHGSVQYQLIMYSPERSQIIVNSFEVETTDGENKCGIGFHQPQHNTGVVRIQITDDGQFVEAICDNDIQIIIEKVQKDDKEDGKD